MYDTDDFENQQGLGGKLYLQTDVLAAARQRIAWTFDYFQVVVVSVSGGKDSTVLANLAHDEAQRRQRPLHLFFLDQEAEYEATITHMRELMALPQAVPHWLQVPVRMTNATSYEAEWLRAWEPGEDWMRPREPGSIHEAPGAPDRFYALIDWFEAQWDAGTCFLVGLRAEESLNRYGATTRHPAIPGVNWSSASKSAVTKLYPIYDWTFEDVWTYLGTERKSYNRVYDWMYSKGRPIRELRVSNLIHERAFVALADLQEFEPATYEALLRRLPGVQVAARYARESSVYQTRTRPEAFTSWLAYRDFLLGTLPNDRRQQFAERFAGQKQTETVYRQQCRQLLINDWENNLPVRQTEERENPLKKWMDIL